MRFILKFNSKDFKKQNYFVLYDMNDFIISYFDNYIELSKILNYRLSDLVRSYNRYKTNIIVIIINNKKYKLATFI